MSIEHKDVAIVIGDQILTGKDCIVKSINVNRLINEPDVVSFQGQNFPLRLAPEPISIAIELTCAEITEELSNFIFGEKDTKRISEKKVKDCNINELFFAIKHKLKENE